MSGSTTAQLKHDIDSGRTGDKVDWPDLAAAPLGTDEEAAGTPPPPDVIAKVRAAELSRPVSSTRQKGHNSSLYILFMILTLLALLAAGIIYQT